MLQTPANPEGLPMEVFDGLRSGLFKDRSQFYEDFAIQFYGANRPGAEVSQCVLDQFWRLSMQAGLKNAYESKGLLRDGLHRGPQQVRCPDPGDAR
jgi:non-heme chloroperoxidase